MSDSTLIVITVISGFPAILSAIVGFINLFRMHELARNTNSIKDALVKSTELAALARGNLEGRAEAKAERVSSES